MLNCNLGVPAFSILAKIKYKMSEYLTLLGLEKENGAGRMEGFKYKEVLSTRVLL